MNFINQKDMLPGGSIDIYSNTKTIRASKDNDGGIIMDEKINEKIDFRTGSIIKYFKRDIELSEDEKLQNIYLYKILAFANALEGNKIVGRVVVYQALYGTFEVFTKSLNEFRTSVNKDKYPNTKQDFAYEIMDFYTDNE